MDGIQQFTTFFIASIIFVMTPGADTMLILNRAMLHGKTAGLFTTIGVNIGVLVHTTFAAFGLSLFIANSITLFAIVKYAGAAYLIWLGAKQLLPRNRQRRSSSSHSSGPARTGHVFHLASGILTNVLNPKVILFFIAFFPQFIRPESLHNPAPFIFLGVVYALLGILWFSLLSVFAASAAERLMRTERFQTWMDRFSGVVFILMGIKIALTRQH